MKKILLLTTLLITMNTATAHSASEKVSNIAITTLAVESIPSYYGVGTGALLGTLVGGPLGLILGSAFGGMVVDDINTNKEMDAMQALSVQHQHIIARQQTELAQISNQRQELSGSFEHVSLNQPQASNTPIIPELLTHIQFATGTNTISPIYQPQLDLLIALLASHDEWLVTLTGYADLRGDETFNFDLSRSRAETVKHYLTQGLETKLGQSITPNIIVKGAGETNTLQTSILDDTSVDIEQLMFDRRVSIEIRPVSDVQVAQQ